MRQLPQCVLGRVDLVTRVVVPEGDVLLQAGRQIKMVEDVLLAQIGRREIVVSGGGKDPEPIVQADGLRQDRGDSEIALSAGPPIP